MAWNYQKEGNPTVEDQRKIRTFLDLLFSLGAIWAVLTATMGFANGGLLVGIKDLAMALQFIVLLASGPQLWSARALGARLVFGVAFIVYLLVQIVPFLVYAAL